MTATTPKGIQAKAAAILAMDEAGTYLGDIRDDAYALMQSLLRDAAGAAHRLLGEDSPPPLPGIGS